MAACDARALHFAEWTSGGVRVRGFRADGPCGRVGAHLAELARAPRADRLAYGPRQHEIGDVNFVAQDAAGRIVGWQVVLEDRVRAPGPAAVPYWAIAFVAAEPRRRGTGRLLLRAAAEAARARGARFVSACAPVAAAAGFYRRCGFVEGADTGAGGAWHTLALPLYNL